MNVKRRYMTGPPYGIVCVEAFSSHNIVIYCFVLYRKEVEIHREMPKIVQPLAEIGLWNFIGSISLSLQEVKTLGQ